MAHILTNNDDSTFPDNDETDFEFNNACCIKDVETAFHDLLAELGKKGWHPAEVAMALADIAEDYIMAFPLGPSLRN